MEEPISSINSEDVNIIFNIAEIRFSIFLAINWTSEITEYSIAYIYWYSIGYRT
jgi:hypothetical protein